MTITKETYDALVLALQLGQSYTHYVFTEEPMLHNEADGTPSCTAANERAQQLLERDKVATLQQ